MLSTLGGITNGFKLKKTRPSTPWTEINFNLNNLNNNKTPTIRIREIDNYRIHIPILEEREQYKIPQSYDRLILTDHVNIMILCGGYAGVHFSPEEMNEIIFLSAEFDNKFKILENYFNTLTTSQKSYVIKDSNKNLSSLSTPLIPNPPPSTLPSETSSETTSFQPPLPPTELIESNEKISKNEDEEIITYFHQLADNVIEVLSRLQPLVKNIQSHLPTNDEIIIKKDDDDAADCSTKPNSLPRPKWLEILLQKYINRQQVSNTTSGSSTPKNSFVLPPIGTFASFLSCCITEQIDCTKIEYDALVELILASNDCNGNILFDNSLSIRNEIFSHTQRYWASRFYQFLRKLPELKSAVKDEQTIYDFKRFL